MVSLADRRLRLGVALALVAVVSLYVLWEVIWTVFFALTFVYVFYPTRRRLVDQGTSPRVAAGALTLLSIGGVLALFVPVLFVIYQRRTSIVEFIRSFPVSLDVTFGEFSYTLDVQALVPVVRATLSGWAVDVASLAPVLGMKAFLFVFIVYAGLYKPGGVQTIIFRAVEGDVQKELMAYHVRIRETLYGLYVVQAATGALTFVLALPVFALLGYDAFFSLAVVCGILQFIPVVGPSLVVVAVAGAEVAGGSIQQAALVLILGLTIVGFLPDAVIRPRLAEHSAGMSPSLYFIGFAGGVFTIGPIGIIVGPLLLSLLVETFELIADEFDPETTSAIGATPDVDGEGDGGPDVDDEGGTDPPVSAGSDGVQSDDNADRPDSADHVNRPDSDDPVGGDATLED